MYNVLTLNERLEHCSNEAEYIQCKLLDGNWCRNSGTSNTLKFLKFLMGC